MYVLPGADHLNEYTLFICTFFLSGNFYSLKGLSHV